MRAIAKRVLLQLRNDHRFFAFSLVVPIAIVYVLYIFFESVQNPFFDATIYVLPIGAFYVHFLTFILTAIVLVRERRAETLQRMLVNGYQPSEIIGGYLLSYTVLGTLQSLLVLAELSWLFELQYSFSEFLSIYFVFWLLAIFSMALGILISNFAQTEGQIFPFIPLILLPSIFVSGIILPVERMPAWTQGLSLLSPLFYANELLQTLLDGGRLFDVPGKLLALPLYGTAVLLLARLTLRKTE